MGVEPTWVRYGFPENAYIFRVRASTARTIVICVVYTLFLFNKTLRIRSGGSRTLGFVGSPKLRQQFRGKGFHRSHQREDCIVACFRFFKSEKLRPNICFRLFAPNVNSHYTSNLARLFIF